MTSDSAVARWLDDTASRQPPDTLRHPGDEFPLRTFSNPPSTSSLSDLSSDDGDDSDRDRDPADVAKLIHPPTPTITTVTAKATLGMEQSTRRRSSSITGAAAAAVSHKEARKHRRRRDDHIAEEGEDSSGNASDSASRSDSTDDDDENMSADGLEDDEETGLTKKVRRKNARRKRRNTLLDQRIVPDAGLSFTREEKALADQSLYRDMLINAALIGLWCESLPWLIIYQGMHANTPQVPLLHLHLRLQQVDVQSRQGRRRNPKHFSFPPLHNMSAHARAVFPSLARSLPHTLPSTPTRLAQPARDRRTCRAS
jgi:hypothetical protein